MAYGNGNGGGQQRSNGGGYNNKPAAGAPRQAGSAPAAGFGGSEPRQFVDDPNEVAIGYEKEMKNGGMYISFTVKKDIQAGQKVSVFLNDKVKNRTEKTPTHKMKLSITKAPQS